MEFKYGLTIAVLLAVITKGHSQLQCYVCDNCGKIDKSTPLETCGEAPTTTMAPTTESTMTTTTEVSTTSGTSTTITTTTGLPTPPTVGPISSTTALPTPPAMPDIIEPETSAVPIDFRGLDEDIVELASVNETSNLTAYTPPTLFVTPQTEEDIAYDPVSPVTSNVTDPSQLLIRQRRNIIQNGMTYHCYKVQKKYGNVYGVQRGCMGVSAEQSVCAELSTANSNQTQKCRPCTTNKCNGSATIGVSIAALLVALVAVIFRF